MTNWHNLTMDKLKQDIGWKLLEKRRHREDRKTLLVSCNVITCWTPLLKSHCSYGLTSVTLYSLCYRLFPFKNILPVMGQVIPHEISKKNVGRSGPVNLDRYWDFPLSHKDYVCVILQCHSIKNRFTNVWRASWRNNNCLLYF